MLHKNYRKIAFFSLALALLVLMPWLGSETLNWRELSRPGSPSHRIFFELRVPRVLLTTLTGASLAILGASYQILFHNPLAEPYVLGVSSAVTLGIALGEVVLGIPAASSQSAMMGALSGLLAVAILSAMYLGGRGQNVQRLVLFGMGLNFVLSSALFLLLSYAYQQMGGGSMRWLFGQIPWISRQEIAILAIAVLPLLGLIFILGRQLDALSFGDSVARTLGVSPARARLIFLVTTSILLSAIVFFTGSIGFLGLVVPHAVRLVFRPPSARILFVYSAVAGALFLAFCDVVSRVLLPPFEFPIGIITTLVGGPVFLVLLWRR